MSNTREELEEKIKTLKKKYYLAIVGGTISMGTTMIWPEILPNLINGPSETFIESGAIAVSSIITLLALKSFQKNKKEADKIENEILKKSK